MATVTKRYNRDRSTLISLSIYFRTCVLPSVVELCVLLVAVLSAGPVSVSAAATGPSSGSSSIVGSGALPLHHQHACVFENHLMVSDKNWYGFLANISVASTGRLTFEFTYPADKCCQNILFYSDEQISIINARMNCWQKEYPLRPDEDVLRLTPSFSWSGCHMTNPNNVPTYVCKGGRSFTVGHTAGSGSAGPGRVGGGHGYNHQNPHAYRAGEVGAYSSSNGAAASSASRYGGDRPATWYIAVSNCASMHGLDLQYRIEVYGHVGECRSAGQFDHYHSHSSNLVGQQPSGLPTPRPVRDPKVAASVSGEAAIAVGAVEAPTPAAGCVIEGEVNTTDTWHGFIANVSIKSSGRIAYQISFPSEIYLIHVILYVEDDLQKLVHARECWDKHGVITAPNDQAQIIELSAHATSNGCSSSMNSTGKIITCRQERRFYEPRRLYVAVNNCRSRGLVFRYRFDVFDYEMSDSCSRATTTTTTTTTLTRTLFGVQTAAVSTAAVLMSLTRLSMLFGSAFGDARL